MSSIPATRATFSDEQLAELLALIKDADSVELKLTVPEPQQRSTFAALGLDPLAAQIRQVFFFDTPELALNGAGVVVRARRMQGKGGDSVVKLRPVVPTELPDALRRAEGFRVEVDALPGGFVCSGTLKGAVRPEDVLLAVAGERPLRKIFTKEQRESEETEALREQVKELQERPQKQLVAFIVPIICACIPAIPALILLLNH